MLQRTPFSLSILLLECGQFSMLFCAIQSEYWLLQRRTQSMIWRHLQVTSCFTSHLPQELRWRPQVCPPPCTFRIQGSSGSSPPCLILNQALSLFRLHKSRWWAISTFSSVFGPVHSFVVAQDVTCHLLLPLAHVRQPSPLPWVVKLPWITQYFLHNKNTHRLLLWLLMVSCFNA